MSLADGAAYDINAFASATYTVPEDSLHWVPWYDPSYGFKVVMVVGSTLYTVSHLLREGLRDSR